MITKMFYFIVNILLIAATCSIPVICIAAWIQHLIVCFTTGAWGFLIGGAIFFPVAIVHGIGIWLGAW